MVTEGDLTWGSEHTIQCTDGLLWNYAPETCVILLTCVTSKNSIKSKKKSLDFIISVVISQDCFQ